MKCYQFILFLICLMTGSIRGAAELPTQTDKDAGFGAFAQLPSAQETIMRIAGDLHDVEDIAHWAETSREFNELLQPKLTSALYWQYAKIHSFDLKRGGCRVNALSFSPNGSLLSVGYDRAAASDICVWDIDSHSIIEQKDEPGYVTSLNFSADGLKLASTFLTKSGTRTNVWDLTTARDEMVDSGSGCFSALFSPVDSNRLALRNIATIRLVDLQSPERDELNINQIPFSKQKTVFFKSTAFSPSGKFIAACTNIAGPNEDTSNEYPIAVWKVPEKIISRIICEKSKPTVVAFSPVNDNILAAGLDDGTIKLWDLSFKQMASTPKIWDVHASKELFSIKAHDSDIVALAFSADGSVLASAGVTDVKLWDVNTRRLIRSFKNRDGKFISIYCIALDRCGKKLAIGYYDGIIRIWQA